MAVVRADRVRDVSTTTGTGALTVSGTAPTGYRAFADVATTGDTLRVLVHNQAVPGEWEVGNYTYSAANTLTRTTVEASSNAGAAVNFSAGTKDVVHVISATEVGSLGGGGTPGGTTLQLQYNNAGAFGGMGGTSWDDTNRSLTIAGATVTASKPVFDLSQTWNNAAVAFTGLKLNVTNTASAATSQLMDLQVGGSSQFIVERTGTVRSAGTFVAPTIQNQASNFQISATAFYHGSAPLTLVDTNLFRDATSILAQRNGANAQSLRVYNTYTDASNYERAVIDWTTTTNTLTIGTQNAGTGTLRDFSLVKGTDVFLTSVTSTVAGLPAASAGLTGARRFVTDANATTFLSTVAGGGSNVVPVFCDGTAWKIG